MEESKASLEIPSDFLEKRSLLYIDFPLTPGLHYLIREKDVPEGKLSDELGLDEYQLTAKEYIKKLGFEIKEVIDEEIAQSEEFKKHVLTEKYDVIIINPMMMGSDYSMLGDHFVFGARVNDILPNLLGLTFFDVVRAEDSVNKETPVIAYSVLTDEIKIKSLEDDYNVTVIHLKNKGEFIETITNL